MTRSAANLHIVRDEEPRQVRGPSPAFVRRRCDPGLSPPTRFEPTTKSDGDHVMQNPALVAWKARKEVA